MFEESFALLPSILLLLLLCCTLLFPFNGLTPDESLRSEAELLCVLYQSNISDENASASEFTSSVFVLTMVPAKVDPLLLLDVLDLFMSRLDFGGGGGGIGAFILPLPLPIWMCFV